MDRNAVVLLCVLGYMVTCVAIGLWAMGRTRTTQDFFMAGRNLGVIITSVALFSSLLSGFGFVGGPGLVYQMGISSFWIVIASSVGFALSYFLLGKRLRLFAGLCGSVSLPDVAEARYGSRGVRLLVAVAILCGVLAYLAAQIKAMAVVLQEIFKSNELPGHESLLLAVAISCAVLVFYCVTGGIIASVYTDLFQGAVMVVAAVLIFFTAARSLEGGFPEMARVIGEDDPEAIGPWGTLGMFACLSWYFLFGLGGVGQPHVVTKMMMTRRVEDARFALPVSLAGYLLAALLWIGIGLLMRAAVIEGLSPLARADDAAPVFLQTYATPALAGVVFAGLFAAIMSTADGFLNIGAAAVVHDIPRALTGRSLERELFWARTTTVLLAVGSAVFSLTSPLGLIGLLGTFGWGVFASALVPAIAFGLNWKRATPAAACASIGLSLVVNLAVLILQLQNVRVPYGVAGGTLALLASLAVFLGVSLLSKPPKIDADVEAVMDM
jgi:Na+/proline symporter